MVCAVAAPTLKVVTELEGAFSVWTTVSLFPYLHPLSIRTIKPEKQNFFFEAEHSEKRHLHKTKDVPNYNYAYLSFIRSTLIKKGPKLYRFAWTTIAEKCFILAIMAKTLTKRLQHWYLHFLVISTEKVYSFIISPKICYNLHV